MLPLLLDAAAEVSEASVTTLDVIIIVGVIAAVVIAYFYFTKKPAPPVIKTSYSTKGITKKDNVVKAEVKGPPVTILFGSQSGTAETFAYELAKEAKTHGFSPKVVDLEEYNHEDDLANEKFVCFLMATFGEGEPTDSAQNFYKWLMDGERDTSSMSSVEYAVFALGNRQYEHYCLVGRKVSSRMAELGATEILEHGEGDDDGSLEDDYAAWRVKFWEAAKAKYGGVETAPAKFEPTIAIKWVESGSSSPVPEESKEDEEQDFVMVDAPGNGKEARLPSVVMDPKHKGGFAAVTDNFELRQDASTGSTRHIEIDISGMPFVYRTADNLGVYPRNDYKLVAKIARRLGVSPKAVFHVEHRAENQRKLPFPSPCTVQDALLWYCDLTSIPKRATLEIFQQYATDATDKAKLAQFIHDGKAAYLEDQKHLLDVLEELPSVKIPFADFLEICPKLIPRYYTISSSARHRPDRLTITVVVARADKPRGRVHQGVCSTYLAALVPGKDKVAVFCRDSTFRPTWELPAPGSPKAGDQSNPLANIRQNCAPMIMIGPGTGVAPFRGFLQEASLLVKSGAKIGDIILFFGCQRQDKDYLYKDEFKKYEEEGIVRLITAFSRETKHKVYVQHRLLEHGAEVWDLVQNKNASIFLCGATTMGTDVRNTLIEIFQKQGGKSQKEASDMVQAMQTQKRLIQELWG